MSLLHNGTSAAQTTILALYSAYGRNRPFFDVWTGEKTVLARIETTFYLYCESGADEEEIAAFLTLSPYRGRLCGDADTVGRVCKHIAAPHRLSVYDEMSLSAVPTVVRRNYEIDVRPPLLQVYQVLSGAADGDFSIGAFEPWYADMSHRIRHGCADAFLVREGVAPVCACAVGALTSRAGLVSGIASLPAWRGRGLATALMLELGRSLDSRGTVPLLVCHADLCGFYTRLGYRKIGVYAIYTFD